MSQAPEDDAEVHTLSLLEEMRAECAALRDHIAGSRERLDALCRQMASPNLHDMQVDLPFSIEMWDQGDQRRRWTIALCSTVSVAHGAFDVAVTIYPQHRWVLRNGMLVIRKHEAPPPRRTYVGIEDA
jgi:hypothetical protein